MSEERRREKNRVKRRRGEEETGRVKEEGVKSG